MLGFGAWRVTQGQMSLDVLLVVLMMGIEVFRPQRDLRALLHTGMMGRAAADDIFTVLDARTKIEPPAVPVDLDGPLAPVVEFDGTAFAYPGGRRTAHRELSFRIDPGERVGFVGESGAGKTTIVRLLLRFYDPDEGVVRIGGHDLRALRPDDIYRSIAVVNQDTYLFHGTVEDNLRFGKPEASDEEIEAAARAANAHEFISRLAQGYGSVIGERGIKLSGGQRQRIAIARALLRDAPILVLDEALSAVDAENEAVIQSALDRLMQGRTTLIFAHRLSSVIGADRILVLDHGSIVETGDHASLMRAGGDVPPPHGHPGRRARAVRRVARGADRSGCETAGDSPRRPAGGRCRRAARADRRHPASRRPRLGRRVPRAAAPCGSLESRNSRSCWVFGIVRVAALIGVGVASALTVAAVKQGEPFTQYLVVLAIIAPLAGVLHWLESWFAHDMAFRMLAEMRIALYEKLDRLAPAYLVRRRTGDLVGMATHDVELVEYFFAHTVAPFFVAVLVPAAVIGTAGVVRMADGARPDPVPRGGGAESVLRTASHRRAGLEGSGGVRRHERAWRWTPSRGCPKSSPFGAPETRGAEFVARIERHTGLRLSFFSDLTKQTAILEAATGLGGLVVIVTGAHLTEVGSLEPAMLPMLALLAMSAFLPVSEIAHIGRQLADTLGGTRRLFAVHKEVEVVRDGPGVDSAPRGESDDNREVTVLHPGGVVPRSRKDAGHDRVGHPAAGSDSAVQPVDDEHGVAGALARRIDARSRPGGIEIEVRNVEFSYFGNRRLALAGATLTVPAGKTLALVGPSGAGKDDRCASVDAVLGPGLGRHPVRTATI